jgi:hypothetical protein
VPKKKHLELADQKFRNLSIHEVEERPAAELFFSPVEIGETVRCPDLNLL